MPNPLTGDFEAVLQASLESGSEHDVWRHVVVTYDISAHALKLYVNCDSGVPDAQVPPPPPALQPPVHYVSNKTNPLRIAAGQIEHPAPSAAPGQFFKGRIDEVALYRRALDGETVKKHFLKGIDPYE